jgi:peptidoglycan/LPS O-acetylase OafA/YrhL
MGREIETVSGKSRHAHLDALRAFAVLLVVVSHAGFGSIVPGGGGVTIFFTISGFIITHVLLRERAKIGRFNVAAFYAKRALKLIPPLLAAVVVPTIIYSFFAPIDWFAVLAQVFFFYNWISIDATPFVLPGSGITWSLAIEEQFYIVFAALWVFLSRRDSYRMVTSILAAGAVLASIGLKIVFVAQGNYADRIYNGTDTRLDSIALGILAAFLLDYLTRQPGARLQGVLRPILGNPITLLTAIGLFVIASLIPGEPYRYIWRFSLQSTAAGLFILYGMIAEHTRTYAAFIYVSRIRFVAIIGLASYSIYLVHYPIYFLIDYLFDNASFWVLAPFRILTGLTFGVLIWRLVEVPLERRKARIIGGLGSRPTAQTVATASAESERSRSER